MDNFKLVKDKIDSITKNAPRDYEYKHSQLVLKKLLELEPKASIPMKIAALGHDIDRSVPERRMLAEDFTNYSDYKSAHAKRSAEIITDIMNELKFNNETIIKTRHLIENHEIGGGEAEILKEADSLTFFDEENLNFYKMTYPRYFEDKIKFMYSRMSIKSKNLVKNIKFNDKEINLTIKKVISELEN